MRKTFIFIRLENHYVFLKKCGCGKLILQQSLIGSCVEKGLGILYKLGFFKKPIIKVAAL